MAKKQILTKLEVLQTLAKAINLGAEVVTAYQNITISTNKLQGAKYHDAFMCLVKGEMEA